MKKNYQTTTRRAGITGGQPEEDQGRPGPRLYEAAVTCPTP